MSDNDPVSSDDDKDSQCSNLTSQELQNRAVESIPKNTRKSTQWALETYKKWAHRRRQVKSTKQDITAYGQDFCGARQDTVQILRRGPYEGGNAIHAKLYSGLGCSVICPTRSMACQSWLNAQPSESRTNSSKPPRDDSPWTVIERLAPRSSLWTQQTRKPPVLILPTPERMRTRQFCNCTSTICCQWPLATVDGRCGISWRKILSWKEEMNSAGL